MTRIFFECHKLFQVQQGIICEGTMEGAGGMEPERKLLKKVKQGNQQAFRTLYDAYANEAIRSAYAITRNNNCTFDIVQETFLKVFRHIDRFDEKKPFKPWFYRILINESLRYMKKESKAAVPMSDRTLEHLNQPQRFHMNEELEVAMAELEPELRTLLVLKYVSGYTEQEIADIIGKPKTTVKSRLYKARNVLKANLGGIANEK